MKYGAIVLFGIILLLPVSSIATTTISGRTLYGDNSWDSSMNPIVVTGDITIALGATLNIGEGCEVRFQENSDDTHWGWDLLRSEIIVYGTLNVNGTASNLATLTSTGTAVNGWFGIIFSDNNATGTIRYCNIDHSLYGINFTACAPAFHYGICTGGTNTTLVDSTIDFVAEGAWIGTKVVNQTTGYDGMVTGITSTVNPNDTLQIAGGMGGLSVNTAGDFYYFRTLLPAAPTVSYCLINDVTTGFFFDNSATPAINDCTIISASTAFGCWGESAPTLTNCNTSGLTGSAKAVYITEKSFPTIVGCSFGSGNIDMENCYKVDKDIKYLDPNLYVSMTDTTVSGSSSGILGHEFKLFGLSKIIGRSAIRVSNCNIIGLGGSGNGIEWDDNIGMLTVEYSRLGGFTRLVWPRWGTDDLAVNIRHMVGPGQVTTHKGTCSGGDHYYLIDSGANFLNLGAKVGMTVTNETDFSTGIVVAITSIPSFPPTNNALQTSGMSSGATNDFGEIYSFPMLEPDYNNIDLGDLGTPDPHRKWPPGHIVSAGQNEFYGVQDPGCLYNIEMEQSGPVPPTLYQLEVWAEGNWWITSNDTVISRYIWDFKDSDYLGKVHYLPHRTPDEKRTYSVSGRVLDAVGSPLESVRVYTDISAQFPVPGHTVLADITDADGYYTIYGLLPGYDYSIIPDKLRYTFTPTSITVTIPHRTDKPGPTDITGQDFTVYLPSPRVINVGRADNQDGAIYGLPGRTNWGLISTFTAIVVTGTDLRATPALFLRGPLPVIQDTKLADTAWVTSTKLTATVPSTMAAGDYIVRLVNPDGQESFFGSASNPGFTIVTPPPTPTSVPIPMTPTPTPTETPTLTPTPTPTPLPPRIKVSTDSSKYKKGSSLFLSMELWPDTINVMRNLIDPYIAGLTPNGRLLFLSKGQWRSSAIPLIKKIMIGANVSFNMGVFEIGQGFPSGTYTIFGVLNAPGTSVFNSKNWRSSLASTTFVVE